MFSKRKVTEVSFLKKITKNISSKHLKNHKLYSPEVTEFTSKIAKIKKVRMLLRKLSKKICKKKVSRMRGPRSRTFI